MLWGFVVGRKKRKKPKLQIISCNDGLESDSRIVQQKHEKPGDVIVQSTARWSSEQIE